MLACVGRYMVTSFYFLYIVTVTSSESLGPGDLAAILHYVTSNQKLAEIAISRKYNLHRFLRYSNSELFGNIRRFVEDYRVCTCNNASQHLAYHHHLPWSYSLWVSTSLRLQFRWTSLKCVIFFKVLAFLFSWVWVCIVVHHTSW